MTKPDATPITDAFIAKEPRIFIANVGDRERESIEIMRQLERELTAARQRCVSLESRLAAAEKALSHILWIKDCGVDATDEHGVFRNHPETGRDAAETWNRRPTAAPVGVPFAELDALYAKATTAHKWHWEADKVKDDPTGRVRFQVTTRGKTITRIYYSSMEGGPTNAEFDARLIVALVNAYPAIRTALAAARSENQRFRNGLDNLLKLLNDAPGLPLEAMGPEDLEKWTDVIVTILKALGPYQTTGKPLSMWEALTERALKNAGGGRP